MTLPCSIREKMAISGIFFRVADLCSLWVFFRRACFAHRVLRNTFVAQLWMCSALALELCFFAHLGSDSVIVTWCTKSIYTVFGTLI